MCRSLCAKSANVYIAYQFARIYDHTTYFNNICVWIYDCWIGGGDDSSLSASASTKPNRVAEELYYSASSSTTIDLQILPLPAISLLLLNVRLHGVGFEFYCFDSRASDKVIHISLCTGYFKEDLPMTFLYVHCTIYSVCTMYISNICPAFYKV